MNGNQRQWDTLIKRIQYNWEHAWINGKECQKYLNILKSIEDIAWEYHDISERMGEISLRYTFKGFYNISHDWLSKFNKIKDYWVSSYDFCMNKLQKAKDENKNYSLYLMELTSDKKFDNYLNFFCNIVQNIKDFTFERISAITDAFENDDYLKFDNVGGIKYYGGYEYTMKKSLIEKLQKYLSIIIKELIRAQKANLSKYDNITRPVQRKHKVSFEEFEDNAKANYLKGKRTHPRHKKQAKGYAYLENSVRRMF